MEADTKANETSVVSRYEFDKVVEVRAPDGMSYRAEAVEVHAVQNNLHQLGIAIHNVHGQHSGGIMVGLGDGSVRHVRSGVP